MFKLFKRKTEKERLEAQYRECLKASFDLSKTNRSASDAKAAEADKILKQIELLD